MRALCIILLLMVPTVSLGADYQWYDAKNPEYSILYRGNDRIGVFYRSTGEYYPWDGTRYGKASFPPVSPPARVSTIGGVDISRISKTPSYSVNGRTCTRQRALDAIQTSLIDDSTKLRLTIVGDAAMRKAVLDAMSSPKMLTWKEQCLIQAYPPDHWTVAKRSLKVGITLQDASGKELGYAPTFEGEDALERLLRRDPKPLLPSSFPTLPGPVWGLAGALIALFLSRTRKPE